MPLSTLACKNAKPADKPYKVADFAGLYLLVKPNGSRLWRFDYSHGGKRKTASFGAFPEVPLLEARERRDNAKRLLRDGVDPMLVKRTAKLRGVGSDDNSFEAVARAWYAAKAPAWSKEHAERLISRLEFYLFPEIGRVPVDQIDPPLLLGVMRKIEKRGAEIARRVLQIVGQIMRFAVAEGRAQRDPSRDLRGALKAAPPVRHQPHPARGGPARVHGETRILRRGRDNPAWPQAGYADGGSHAGSPVRHLVGIRRAGRLGTSVADLGRTNEDEARALGPVVHPGGSRAQAPKGIVLRKSARVPGAD